MRIIQKVQLHYYTPSMDSLTLPQGLLAGVSCWLSCLVMIDIVMTTWHHPHASTLKTLYKYSCEIVQISTICHPSSVLSGPKLSDLQISCCWAPENVVTPSTEMRRRGDIFILGPCLAPLPGPRTHSWILEYSPHSCGRPRCSDAERGLGNRGKMRDECTDCQLQFYTPQFS